MGRPRSISREDWLEHALLLFWEHGYDRTSIADLSEAIGVGPSSIYNTFGSKAEFFRGTIDRYIATYADHALQRIGTDSGEGPPNFALGLMRELVKHYTTKGQPTGCAIFQAGGSGSPPSSSAWAITQEAKDNLQSALWKRFEAYSKAGGELSGAPKTLARFVVATLCGLSQLARDGTSRSESMKIAEHAAQSCAPGQSPDPEVARTALEARGRNCETSQDFLRPFECRSVYVRAP